MKKTKQTNTHAFIGLAPSIWPVVLELCGFKHSFAQVRFYPFLKMNGLFILGKSVTFLMNIHHTNYRPLKRFGAIFKKN